MSNWNIYHWNRKYMTGSHFKIKFSTFHFVTKTEELLGTIQCKVYKMNLRLTHQVTRLYSFQ